MPLLLSHKDLLVHWLPCKLLVQMHQGVKKPLFLYLFSFIHDFCTRRRKPLALTAPPLQTEGSSVNDKHPLFYDDNDTAYRICLPFL